MKHLFLVNPAAGKRGSTEALLRRVEETFSPLGLEHEVVLTSSAGDAERLARRAACSGGPVRIYACGGDGTLNEVVKSLYGPEAVTRFRPHHFPFTEPSCEMDVQCHKCGGVGCPTCKGEGWIELLGAGMIHPKVLKMSGIDPEVYSGWAFGIGLERTAMRRFKIADLRLIFENDVRFLEQF